MNAENRRLWAKLEAKAAKIWSDPTHPENGYVMHCNGHHPPKWIHPSDYNRVLLFETVLDIENERRAARSNP